MLRKRKHYKQINAQEFNTLKTLLNLVPTSKVSTLTGRGSSTLSYIKRSSDFDYYANWMKEKGQKTQERLKAREQQTNGFAMPVNEPTGNPSQLDRLEHEVRHLNQKLDFLLEQLGGVRANEILT